MTTHAAMSTPTYSDPVFDHAVALGIDWHLRGDEAFRIPNAQLIVDYIRDNILECHDEGVLSQERFLDLAGFLTGWIIGQFLTEEAHG